MKEFNPSLSIDCVIFGLDLEEQALKILVYERDIFHADNVEKKNLKLPGSLLEKGVNLDESAHQTLFELTGLKNIYLKQFHAFGDIDRINSGAEQAWIEKHYQTKIGRIVTVAYYALIRIDRLSPDQSKIKDKLRWIDINNAHNLAFDHSMILKTAREVLCNDLRFQNVSIFELLPKKFSLSQLQMLYEIILGVKLDKRNFRKKVSKADYVVPLGEKQIGVSHKPAALYAFNKKKFDERDTTHHYYFTS